MGIKNAPQIGEALNVLTHYFNNFFVLAETFGHKKSSLIMDKEQSKCFHNGIILIVNCFRFQR